MSAFIIKLSVISVSNCTSNVPSITVLPVLDATVNLSVVPDLTAKFASISTVPSISTLPFKWVVPPTLRFSEIPAPPVTTNVPVVGVFQVDPVFVVSLRLPAMIGASVPVKTSLVLVAL